MRQDMEYLARRVRMIDVDNLYQAISEIKDALIEIIEGLDAVLPQPQESEGLGDD